MRMYWGGVGVDRNGAPTAARSAAELRGTASDTVFDLVYLGARCDRSVISVEHFSSWVARQPEPLDWTLEGYVSPEHS